MDAESAIAATVVLVEKYRDTCLWFWRRDFFPRDAEAALRALEMIERYGDRDAYVRARELRPWLSPPSSQTS